jgi:hypothetical protein
VITAVPGAGGSTHRRRLVTLDRDTIADRTGAYRWRVLRLVLSPRWILWHLLTLSAMATCGFLSAWQWGRAGSSMGSALNVGYGLQWPLFAVFFAFMWWRFLRMEVAKLHEDRVAGIGTGSDTEGEPEPAVAATAADDQPAGPSPFGPRPATWKAPPVTDAEDPQLAAYNRMLAVLAARDAAG